jgi:hypothetical protein
MSDWTGPLANAILEDRIDRGETAEGSRRKAERYRRFLRSLEAPHDVATCTLERAIRRWPGDLCFHAGQASVFVARQGAGKTNAISFLIQKALRHRPAWDVYTNVPFPWDGELKGIVPSPANLHAVGAMSELLRGIGQTILANRIPAVAIDEMDQATTSHEWASDRSESWTKFLFVERHFRVRGPLLAYHVYEHVPLPLRRAGALRGSYFRVVVRGGERRLARVEDLSTWWVVGESSLPFQTLGLRGFDIDVDMADLETHLDGNRKQVALQLLAYLDARAQAKTAGDAQGMSEAELSPAARRAERAKTLEQIVEALVAGPKLKSRPLMEQFHVGPRTIRDLRVVADRRRLHLRDAPAPVTVTVTKAVTD